MDLLDTIPLMQSHDYKERFKAEYWQLKIRYNRLGALLNKIARGTVSFVPDCPVELLVKQHEMMSKLLDVMETRADYEELELNNG